MIKINLLGGPRQKKSRKGFEVHSWLIVGSGLLAVVIVVVGYVWILLDEKISSLQDQKVQLSQELEMLKKQVQEVDHFERDKKLFEERIGIIQKLRKVQAGPVHLLDEVSRKLPERVWVLNMSEQNGSVELQGKAITNSEIVEFIENLKHSSYFRDIQLIESRQSVENSVPVYDFRLKWTLIT